MRKSATRRLWRLAALNARARAPLARGAGVAALGPGPSRLVMVMAICEKPPPPLAQPLQNGRFTSRCPAIWVRLGPASTAKRLFLYKFSDGPGRSRQSVGEDIGVLEAGKVEIHPVRKKAEAGFGHLHPALSRQHGIQLG